MYCVTFVTIYFISLPHARALPICAKGARGQQVIRHIGHNPPCLSEENKPLVFFYLYMVSPLPYHTFFFFAHPPICATTSAFDQSMVPMCVCVCDKDPHIVNITMSQPHDTPILSFQPV